jgi:hypothetical protein
MRPAAAAMLRGSAAAASTLAEDIADRLASTRTPPAAALAATLCLASRANLALGDDALTEDEMIALMRCHRQMFEDAITATLPEAFRA